MTKVLENKRINDSLHVQMEKRQISLPSFQEIGRDLIDEDGIIEVSLFQEEGGVLDFGFLIVVDDDNKYNKFVNRLYVFTQQNKENWNRAYSNAVLRIMALSTTWNINTNKWRMLMHYHHVDIHFDVCVVPKNWQDKLSMITRDIPHRSPALFRSFHTSRVIGARRW